MSRVRSETISEPIENLVELFLASLLLGVKGRVDFVSLLFLYYFPVGVFLGGISSVQVRGKSHEEVDISKILTSSVFDYRYIANC